MILYSLTISDDIKHFDLDKVSFHFSKQVYFSHEMFKKISQEYFKIVNPEIDSYTSFFIKEKENYVSKPYKGLYSEDKIHILVITNVFDLFFSKNIAKNQKSKNLLILFLNTLDINLTFSHSLSKINEFIFYENSIPKPEYKVSEIQDIENLNLIEEIIKNLQHVYQKSSIQDLIFRNKNISETKKDFYIRLFKEDTSNNKVKILEWLNLESKHWEIEGFYNYNGNFNNIALTVKTSNLTLFTYKDTVLDKNIKEIAIHNSKINFSFLADILNINELESLTVSFSDIIMKKDTLIRNQSIKYFYFNCLDITDFPLFYRVISMLTGLKKISFRFIDKIEFVAFEISYVYIKELMIYSNSHTKYFVKLLENQSEYTLLRVNSIVNEEFHSNSLKFLFEKYDLCRLKTLYLSDISIGKTDSGAIGGLLYLEKLNIERIILCDIFFSELFCTSKECNIKILWVLKVNINIADLKFISNLNKLKNLIFVGCNIQQITSMYIKMSFIRKFRIKLW
ncbi:hypothetical protein CWI38_0213p0010 [Hamiltosporidium tvaerminnensis]|uniref:Uncharacterized protein n=2 Tax=Hamiltosporidium tvaerminnensis TaxID=1176355 RepID=A0A4Q9M183_9MICR|nr:hypothetical protein CWI38_0213p0010 [Hamiltosporidium tvaerminnensis]